MKRALLVLPLLLLPACSGGDDDGDDLEDRRAVYVAEAEEVCREANEQVAALGTPASVAEVPATADRAVEIVRTTVAEVTALTPPEEDREELERLVLDPLREDVTTAEAYAAQLKEAAAANDGARLLQLVQERPQTSADLRWMREYGFAECVAAVDQRD